MGSVSLAISNAAKEAGVHIVTNTEVCLLDPLVQVIFFLNVLISSSKFPSILDYFSPTILYLD